MKARMSALPILQFCGMAPKLDVGAGRAAAMSTAFHAYCAGAEDVDELFAALSEKERSQIEGWKVPTTLTIEVEGSVEELEWEDAIKEHPCGFDGEGKAVDKDGPDCLVGGTADAHWVVDLEDELPIRVLVLTDLKKSRWTTVDGVDSLQLHGYAQALAEKHGADFYVTTIWLLEEGKWLVGEPVELDGIGGWQWWSRIKAAAENAGTEYATGSHCSGCYQRLRCPAHMVESIDNGPPTIPGTNVEELDNDMALHLLQQLEEYKDTADALKEHLTEWASRNGGIRDGKGKAWMPCMQKGRESGLGAKKLREVMGEEAEQYIRRGAPFSSMRWVKVSS